MNDKITYFYDQSQSQNLFLLEFNDYLHDLKLIQQLNDERQIEFSYDLKGEQGLSRDQKVVPNTQFSANVSKSIEGLGLHRTIKYRLEMDIRNTNLQEKECQALVLDYLDYDQYLDIEEFNNQE